jgi:6-pyruvoyltetrahydropterin/6-carboxytetrahydropterin synthase
MFRIQRNIDFCYGHRLPGDPGKCGHLHGHNARAEIVLQADGLDGRDMVADFSEVDRKMKTWIDEHLDHRMLLHRDDPLVEVLQNAGEPVFLMDANPTAEVIARLLFVTARQLELPAVEVRIWETCDSLAVYSP